MRTLDRRPAPRRPAPVGRTIHAILLVGLGGLAGGLAGCGTIEPVAPAAAPITDPAQLYTGLTLDYPAVTLSTAPGYNTVQLTATPRDALGNPMSGLPAPVFTSLDTSSVRVTADGLVTAVQATTGARVIATLVVGPVGHVDTAVVMVTTLASPPRLASLSIQPVVPDSAIWSMIPPIEAANLVQGVSFGVIFRLTGLRAGGVGDPSLAPRLLDDGGAPLANLPIAYSSLDAAVATIDPHTGTTTLIRPGQVRLVARTMAYGVAKADIATFTVTTPILAMPSFERDANGAPGFVPNSVRVAPYGFVSFTNRLDDSVDVVFDDPTNVVAPPAVVCNAYAIFSFFFSNPVCTGAGNMLLSPKNPPNPILQSDGSEATIQVRQFLVPGVYPYHSVRTGARGRIVVNAEYVDE